MEMNKNLQYLITLRDYYKSIYEGSYNRQDCINQTLEQFNHTSGFDLGEYGYPAVIYSGDYAWIPTDGNQIYQKVL